MTNQPKNENYGETVGLIQAELENTTTTTPLITTTHCYYSLLLTSLSGLPLCDRVFVEMVQNNVIDSHCWNRLTRLLTTTYQLVDRMRLKHGAF